MSNDSDDRRFAPSLRLRPRLVSDQSGAPGAGGYSRCLASLAMRAASAS
jgi:hypothetical protein